MSHYPWVQAIVVGYRAQHVCLADPLHISEQFSTQMLHGAALYSLAQVRHLAGQVLKALGQLARAGLQAAGSPVCMVDVL